MKKRVFVAIDIPQEIRRELKKIQDTLPEFKGKKTEPYNLHLTLKFLGEVASDTIEKVKGELGKIKFKSFDVEINKIGFFDNRASRIYDNKLIVWIFLTNCEELQQKIDSSLEGLFKPERRFMSHLTLARVKNVKDKDKFLKELEKIKLKNITFMVNEFKLKKSTLTEHGSVYEDLEVYSLG